MYLKQWGNQGRWVMRVRVRRWDGTISTGKNKTLQMIIISSLCSLHLIVVMYLIYFYQHMTNCSKSPTKCCDYEAQLQLSSSISSFLVIALQKLQRLCSAEVLIDSSIQELYLKELIHLSFLVSTNVSFISFFLS